MSVVSTLGGNTPQYIPAMESMPEANGEVINQRTVQVFVPYKYLYLFDEPRMAHVSFEGSNNASYNCDIIRHNAELIHREDGNYFMAVATMCTQEQNVPCSIENT
ncbi:MAG TPA: hypothetical protein PLP97_13265 [Prevotella sp.]|nr:hypothetical protein [Prevotella sp.]